MPKFTINRQPIAGFAAEKAEAGQRDVKVLTKTKLITSDNPMFHVHMKHISDLFISKTKVPIVLIHKLLIILHKDNTADIYINDFNEMVRVKVKEAVKAGEAVYRSNISDVAGLKFPDIEIKKDDAIIYCLRTDWRFSLYFDFSREIDLEKLERELGELKKDAEFYSLLISAEEEVNRITALNADAFIFTEGKSDWKHLEKAAARLKLQMDLGIWSSDDNRGSGDLLKMCEHYSRIPQHKKFIFIFDRDEEFIIKELQKRSKDGVAYQDWGNNVYSLLLPIPPHRSEDKDAVSIELFYTDDELRTKDENGRRLFFSDEFDRTSGKHNSESMHSLEMNKIKRNKKCVIDSNVFDSGNNNVALPKDDFADYILKDKSGFEDFNFENFQAVFNLIDKIAKAR